MEKKFKEIYDQVRMSEECSQRIEQAMQNKAEGTSNSLMRCGWTRRPEFAVTFVLAVVVLFLLADRTVYAYTGWGIISRISSFAGNAVFTREIDEEGNHISTGTFNTSEDTAPAEFKEGRLWFTANGENIDITDQVSENKAYVYDYTDGQGITHYLIVGGDPETFGYAEFMYDKTQPPGWIGGYFTAGKVGETINPNWLEKAKKELNIPW